MYLVTKNIARGSKTELEIEGFLETKVPSNPSILLSTKEKACKIVFNKVERVTEAQYL